MKGSNSRLNHRPEARFSNLAHIQGGMVTDADLTEAGQIHQARDEAQARIAAGSGVPAKGGMVALSAGHVPSLQPGLVVAEGKIGNFAFAPAAGASLSSRFANQVDLPGGPALPAGPVFLYADLWERPVFASEDPRLTDPGLHGVETSYRTRTMVQIKALPLANVADVPAAAAQLAAGAFPFLRKGTALASIQPVAVEVATDPCDPCASTVEIDRTLPNALFRLEVIQVDRNAGGTPLALTLAWSLENAEAIESRANLADATTADAFHRPPAAYEFFSAATDAQAGAFPGSHVALRPGFAATPTASLDAGLTHVRRWDGKAKVSLAGGPATEVLGSGALSVVAGKVVLAVEAFSLTLDVQGKQLVAGDYWLVELRRYAPETQQLTLVGADAAGANALPHGIAHAFCPLFATLGDAPPAVEDITRRRLSMPTLADLPADHVGYTPDCPTWYGPVENVQEALDALCNLPADKVFYDPPCPDWYGEEVQSVGDALDALCNLPADKISFTPPDDCPRFGGEPKVTNVAQALERLCKVEDTSALSLVLRTMMDWGVVCGLRLSSMTELPAGVKWTAGTVLDQTGRIVSVPAGFLDLAKAPGIDLGQVAEIQKKEGEVCLSVSFDDKGTMHLHLTDHATARGKDRNSMAAAIESCVSGKNSLSKGQTLNQLTSTEARVMQKVSTVWSGYRALKGSAGLSVAEYAMFDKVSKGMLADYAKDISATDAKEISALWEQADASYGTAGLAMNAADNQRMQRAVAKAAVMERYEGLSLGQCQCLNGLTPCPPPADEPSLVPLGCVTFDFAFGEPRLTLVCNYCCRKQALTWRSYRFYDRPDFIAETFSRLKSDCCVPQKAPDPGKFDDFLDDIQDFEPYYPFDPDIPIDINRFWPPKQGVPVFDGGFTDPAPDYTVVPGIKDYPVDTAIDILTGHGLEHVQTIDLGASPDGLGAAMALAETGKYGGSLKARPQAGDKVVVLASGGKALDYVVVGQGSGRFVYPTSSDKVAQQQAITRAVDEAVKAAVPKTIGTVGGLDTGELKAEMADLALNRDQMSADVERLSAEVAALETRRSQAFDSLSQISLELTRLTTARDQTLASITAAQKAVQDLQALQAKALTDFRAASPVETLGLDSRLVTQLKTDGILTVQDLNAATTTQLNKTITAAGVPLTSADLKLSVTTFLKK